MKGWIYVKTAAGEVLVQIACIAGIEPPFGRKDTATLLTSGGPIKTSMQMDDLLDDIFGVAPPAEAPAAQPEPNPPPVPEPAFKREAKPRKAK